ncbi:RHS repeat-associated core domain-containing protein [Candidatus Aenigmatarchaeota archaeon]
MKKKSNPIPILLLIVLAIVLGIFAVFYEINTIGEFRIGESLSEKGVIDSGGSQQIQLPVDVEQPEQRLPLPGLIEDDEVIYAYGAGLIAKVDDNEVQFYHQDYLSSNRFSSGPDGQLTSKNVQYPYGSDLSDRGTKEAQTSYKFTGQEKDASLYYYSARYYDPGTARFISVDPLASVSSSPYSYAANNPIRYIDPTGMKEKPIAALFYSSESPEFLTEVNQYMSNYKDRFEFKVYGVYGKEDMTSSINELNGLIEGGRTVSRVNFFDHSGTRMFGIGSSVWSVLPQITPQTGRAMIMGTCYATNNEVFNQMLEKSGSDYYVGLSTRFYGITRYPVQNDLDGLLFHSKEKIAQTGLSFNDVIEQYSNIFTPQDFAIDARNNRYGYYIVGTVSDMTAYDIIPESVPFIHGYDLSDYSRNYRYMRRYDYSYPYSSTYIATEKHNYIRQANQDEITTVHRE